MKDKKTRSRHNFLKNFVDNMEHPLEKPKIKCDNYKCINRDIICFGEGIALLPSNLFEARLKQVMEYASVQSEE